MSSLLSVRLDDTLFHGLKANARLLNLSQTDYVRAAIEHMNEETERQMRAQRLKKASLRVRKESMKINAEFGKIEHDPKA